MTEDVYTELSSLRHMLSPSSGRANEFHGSAAQLVAAECDSYVSPQAAEPEYDSVLQGTQKGVQRLSCAMDLADEKIDDALRHTEHVHRLVASNRDLELTELRKVVAEKEQGIDELRETLACTKRAYEGRVRQLQTIVSCRESQMASMAEKVTQFDAAQSEAAVQEQRLQGQIESMQANHAKQNEDLRTILQESQSALTQLRGDKEQLSQDCTEQQQALKEAEQRLARLAASHEELQQKYSVAHRDIDELEASCQILKKKLIAERKVRKASEQWLRAELKSREDMESLFGAVREITLANSFSGSKSHRIRELLDTLQVSCQRQQVSHCSAGLPIQCPSQTSASDRTGGSKYALKSRLDTARRALH
eukprot:jgi/Ulvmu1/4605/UM002_0334.1